MWSARNRIASLILKRNHFSRRLDRWAISRVAGFSQTELQQYQISRLRNIIKHAYANVPYWGDLLSALPLNPETIKTFDDFARLPVLKKDTVRERHEEFIARGHGLQEAIPATTSGSEGMPLQVVIDKKGLERRNAMYAFYFGLFGLQGFNELLNLFAAPYFRTLGRLPLVDLYTIDFKDLHAWIENGNIRRVFGPLSTLVSLAERAEHSRTHLGFKTVHCGGEYLSLATRNYLEQVFRCPVYNHYGAAEVGTIGYECKARQGFHVNSANIFLEIIGEDGTLVRDNQNGNIVITSFESRAMPFIRYAIGDRGSWIPGECLCGLTSPRITFEGRDLYFLNLSGGRKYPLWNIINDLNRNYQEYIKQFQFVQETINRIVVKVVPTEKYEDHRGLLIARFVLDKLPPSSGLDIRLEKVASIEKTPRGKSLLFVSKV